jgi:hypothetical protein
MLNSTEHNGKEFQMSQVGRLRLGALMVLILFFSLAGYAWFSIRGHSPPTTPGGTEPRKTSSDPVADCRELAPLAPEDPGTADDAASSERALVSCLEAEKRAPENPEIIYLTAKSALGAQYLDDARPRFQKAAKLNYCQAYYYLGEDAWHSKHDADSAGQYYSQGAACGDDRAAHKIFNPADYAASAYPKYIAALYNSDIEELNHVRFFTASYVAGLYEQLSEQYLGGEFKPCWAATYYKGGDVLYGIRAAEKGDGRIFLETMLYEKYIPTLYFIFFPDQGQKALEEIRETARKAGHADLIRMVESSQCGELLPYKIVKGIETFAAARRSLWEVAAGVYPEIHSFGDIATVLTQRGQSSPR